MALPRALGRTIATTGKSIVYCILTTGAATIALATSDFKGFAEFGSILSVGLVMLLIHMLVTLPAMVCLWMISLSENSEGSFFWFLVAIIVAPVCLFEIYFKTFSVV